LIFISFDQAKERGLQFILSDHILVVITQPTGASTDMQNIRL